MKKTLTLASARAQVNRIELKDRLFMERREKELRDRVRAAEALYLRFENRRHQANERASGLRGHISTMLAHGIDKMVFIDGFCCLAPVVKQ